MILQDLHTHSKYDDGKGSLWEVAETAEKMGLASVGFSGHSPLPYENGWSMTEDALQEYLEEGKQVKAAKQGSFPVFLGMEYDLLSAPPPEGLDYVIGSVHHVLRGDQILFVDKSVEDTREFVACFGGADQAAQAYFDLVGTLAEKAFVDIVGHFDLLTKFNEKERIFDTEREDYIAAGMRAMEKLVKAGKIFEVNTGAIGRGYRTEPYPSKAFLKALRAMGGKITITSDVHKPENLCYGFEQAKELVKESGFTEIYQLIDGAFRPVKI